MYKDPANQELVTDPLAGVLYVAAECRINLTGAWVWSTIEEQDIKNLIPLLKDHHEPLTIDGSKITTIDTVGAFFISRMVSYAKLHGISITDLIIPEFGQKFFDKIDKTVLAEDKSQDHEIPPLGFLATLGELGYSAYNFCIDFVTFFGQFLVNFFHFIKAPLQLQWKDVARTIDDAGVKGMWVAMLLSFLIGITLAYEMSPQFITYGANVYVVNFLGIALLKEVSPLLTAIIMAGRTGASMTAEIGIMKVQEEIDAIQTMGISPMKRLVLPKVIGLLIALPLVTSLADIASMYGGAIVSRASLGVSYTLFLERVQTYVAITNYTVGIYKSIAFALLISLVACYCGFRVEGNANSVGEQTTRSVVIGIISIVFADAIFAVVCKVLGV